MKLDFSNAWADAMGLLRGHLELVLTIAGVFLLLPPLLVEVFIPFESAAEDIPTLMQDFSQYLGRYGGILLLVGLVSAFGQVAIIRLLLDHARPTVGQALAKALPLLPWYFLTSLIVGLILIGGGLLFVIPGLYLLGRLAVAGVVVVAEERRNPFDAIRRSFAVTRGNGWRAFLLFAIVWVTGTIVTLAIGTIIGIVLAIGGLGETGVGAFLSAFVSSLLGAALSLVLLLIYIAIYRQLGAAQTVSVPSTRGT